MNARLPRANKNTGLAVAQSTLTRLPKINLNVMAVVAGLTVFVLPEPRAIVVIVVIAIFWLQAGLSNRNKSSDNSQKVHRQEVLGALFFLCLLFPGELSFLKFEIWSPFAWIVPTLTLSLILAISIPVATSVFLKTRKSSAIRARRVPPNPVRINYVGCYLGLASFMALLSFLPGGLGAGLYQYLASILNENQTNIAPAGEYLLLLDSTLFLALYLIFQQRIVVVSAKYDAIMTRFFIFGGSIHDAFKHTYRTRCTRLILPEEHPHIQAAASTLLWLTFIYLGIFAVILFCPGEIGQTIKNWLQDSLIDASYDINLADNNNLLIFIAAVVASWCAVPLAVSCRSLVPAKRSKYLVFSEQGVVAPYLFNTIFGSPPIFFWNELQTVSVSPENESHIEKSNKPHQKKILKLKFKGFADLKLHTNHIDKERLAEFIYTIDKRAPKCLIEPEVLNFHHALLEQTKHQTLTELKKFSSTVFFPLKPADSINGYRIIVTLAGKSLTATYLARNQKNELVILKEFFVPVESAIHRHSVDAFEQEYNLLKSLHHSNIAKVIDTFTEQSSKYLVTEYISGTDLRKLIASGGALSETVVMSWAFELAVILQYLHTQDPVILHRDLTPDNIMLADDGTLRVIDFGASHILSENVTGTLIGKQCYIAPEQLRGKASLESDIYSFGCTLYFLLSGCDPRALEQSDLQKVTSDETRRLVAKCTEFESANRFHSFQEIISLLEQDAKPHRPILKKAPLNFIEANYGL